VTTRTAKLRTQWVCQTQSLATSTCTCMYERGIWFIILHPPNTFWQQQWSLTLQMCCSKVRW